MDIQLAFKNGFYDLGRAGWDLATDSGLETAVIVSLFTDRRAEPGDRLPDNTSDRRGWWADAWPTVDNDRIGSRLWLLAREKQTMETARRAETYAAEALQWLIDDGIARAARVAAEWTGQGVLAMSIEIERPSASPLTYKFASLWEARHAL